MSESMESEIVPLQHADGAKSPTHWQSLKATGAKLELAIEVVRFLRSNTLMIIVVVVVLSAGLIKLPDLIKMFHPFSTEAMGATEAVPTTPATPKVAPAPAKASYRLFEEYPLVQTDMNALTPQERARSILVSLRHLSPRERTAWSVRWTASPEAREIAPGSGIYRIPCSGAVAGEFLKLMKDYPYAVAPGSRTDPAYAASYRSVTERRASPCRWSSAATGSSWRDSIPRGSPCTACWRPNRRRWKGGNPNRWMRSGCSERTPKGAGA